MKRFAYLRDSLFLACCGLYAMNRWVVEPRVQLRFFHDHFNDLLLIPCALPPLLWFHRLLRLRLHDGPPAVSEIALYVLVWSILFEAAGPFIVRHSVGDPWDAVAYALGGLLAGLWWHRDTLSRRLGANEL